MASSLFQNQSINQMQNNPLQLIGEFKKFIASGITPEKAELLDYLHKYHFPNAKIVGHRDIGASACPGKYYPFEELKNYKTILNNEEELTMSQYEELKKEIAELKSTIAERTGYYNYIDDNMNEAFKPTIKKLVESGKLKGNEKGELMFTTDMMRMLTILDRAGAF